MATGAVAVLALTACGPSDEELAAERLAAAVEFVWSYEDHLLSDVEQVGGNALAYVAEAGHMYLLARDVATGQEQWKHKALAGFDSSHEVPEIVVSEHGDASYVAYYAVSQSGPGVHRVVDVETGEHFDKRGGQPIYASQPLVCGTTFCAEGTRWYSTGPDSWEWGDDVRTEFDWERGRWMARKATAGEIPMVAEGAQMAGSNLSISREEDEWALGYGRGGQLLWDRNLTDIFGVEFSFDVLHAFSANTETSPLLYGAYRAGDERKEGEDTVTTHDLTERTSLVRLDKETGETLWEAPGVAASCDGPSGMYGPDNEIIVGCGYDAGTLTVRETPDGEGKHEEADVEAYAVRVDADTGEELWRFELGEAPEGVGDFYLLAGDRHRQVWDRDSKLVTLSMETGEAVAPDDVFEEVTLCGQERDRTEVRAYTQAEDHTWSKGGDLNELARYSMRFPCERESGESTEEMPTLAEFRRAGYEDEQEYVVLPGRTGMAAYKLPQLEDVDVG